ncbi:MAG: ABC transporter permease [Metallibacterium scheffleri]|jgi:putative ABC transport system permease protein|uniref:ABC transporter permease n=1 Tax=Metallibacterium scheffleri TaxID=993689 RepID=UPI0026EA341A|nr:FtsX-like permease family protein [Metallibacterium scheffleri]MCK9366232.1 ABC transporter permease [Metallibacterium scheffleri]
MMTPRPILSALRRHKIAALLIVLEIALAFAIVSNAVYLVIGRLQRVDLPSGIDERNLVLLRLATAGKQNGSVASAQTDLAALRVIPGVESASAINTLPLSGSQWGLAYSLRPMRAFSDGGVGAPVFFGGPELLQTLGIRVVQGDAFRSSDYSDLSSQNAIKIFVNARQALITKAFAQRLWPHVSAVGKVMYMGETPVLVVGVVSNIIGPYINANAEDPSNYYGVISPFRAGPDLNAWYALRCQPAECARVLKTGAAKLQAMHPTETLNAQESFMHMRQRYFRNDRSMAWLLVCTVIALLGVTAIGIVGLASFWVQQRTRQIGVRRALGARRVDILRYFQTENFLLATVGIALGCAAAIGINVWLMAHYAVPRLPIIYLPIGAVALWLLGQLAVLGPALRAARVPPTTAMRAA